MPKFLNLSRILLSFSIGMSCLSNAAQPLKLDEIGLLELQRHFSIKMPGVMASQNLQSMDALEFVKEHEDKNHITHVRMQQYYDGYLVFGGYGIFHSTLNAKHGLSFDNNQIYMNGILYNNIGSDIGAAPSWFKQKATNALTHFKTTLMADFIREEAVQPIVYIKENKEAIWAYWVSALVEHREKIPERPTAILDARTLNTVVQWNDIKTYKTKVKAVGFGGNARTQKLEYGNHFPYLYVLRDNNTGQCYMENSDVRVVDMQHEYYRQNRPMQFKCFSSDPLRPHTYWTGYDADGYDEQNGAYSPSNDALYAGIIINRMYKRWYGIPPLTHAGKPMQLIMRVHYGRDYENAFWNGKEMTFGDGDHLMHPLVSLGVSAHEISHGFTEQHSNLVYYGQSGGMNEAFSDMAAQAVEYYTKRKSSWKIGAELFKQDSGYAALRFMDTPSLDGYSIDRADQYTSGLDVHYSSGVYNRLFYLLAKQRGWNTHKAFDVMVKANMDYWTPYSSFQEGGCGVLNAAYDLGLPIEDVTRVLAAVAIPHEQCGRISFKSRS